MQWTCRGECEASVSAPSRRYEFEEASMTREARAKSETITQQATSGRSLRSNIQTGRRKTSSHHPSRVAAPGHSRPPRRPSCPEDPAPSSPAPQPHLLPSSPFGLLVLLLSAHRDGRDASTPRGPPPAAKEGDGGRPPPNAPQQSSSGGQKGWGWNWRLGRNTGCRLTWRPMSCSMV